MNYSSSTVSCPDVDPVMMPIPVTDIMAIDLKDLSVQNQDYVNVLSQLGAYMNVVKNKF